MNTASIGLNQGWNETSQFGEDGLIADALERYGIRNEWCFEVGAGDGKTLSNTWSLRRQGWKALLVESDAGRFHAMREVALARDICACRQIGPHDLDTLLDQTQAPCDLDLGVIDVDGQDFWIWAGLRRYLPRLMLVEFGPDEFVPRLGATTGQADRELIEDMGKVKGYTVIAETQCNLLFVRNGLQPIVRPT